MQEDPRSKIYQHVKTGGLYIVLENDAFLEKSVEQCTIYKSLQNGKIWIRPYTEFWDGRFRCILKDELKAISQAASSSRIDNRSESPHS